MNDKFKAFAELLEKEQIEDLHRMDCACETNIQNKRVSVKPGKKYTKVDIGTCGRFMVDNATGDIYGIKAYGQIHKGHWYGTLDTINEYHWGEYYPRKKTNPTPMQGSATPIPQLTHKPQLDLASQ